MNAGYSGELRHALAHAQESLRLAAAALAVAAERDTSKQKREEYQSVLSRCGVSLSGLVEQESKLTEVELAGEPTPWTRDRGKQFEKLKKLISEVRTINSDTGTLQRLARCIDMAQELDVMFDAQAQPGFMTFLEMQVGEGREIAKRRERALAAPDLQLLTSNKVD